MSKPWTPERIAALRAMSADWWEGIHTVDPDDIGAQAALQIMTGALVGFVPDLLDEVERLQKGAPAEKPHMVKMDSQRGYA